MRGRLTAATSPGCGGSGGCMVAGRTTPSACSGSIRGDGFMGGGGPGEPWAKVTSVVNFGALSSSQGPGASDFVHLVDKRWEGTTKTVIMELAIKNKNLETRIKACQAEIEKNRLEKRASARIQKERLLFGIGSYY